MKTLTSIIIILIIAVLGVGVVGAQEPNQRPEGFDRIGTILDAVSSATGLSRDDIIQMSQRDGKTLAEIITENGGDVNAVQAEIVAAFTADLTEQMSTLDEQVNNLLNNPLRPPGEGQRNNRPNDPVLGALVGTIADMSDLEPGDIGPQLDEGVTLAQIATNAGLDPQVVADAALAKFQERLDEAVSNGRVNEEDAATHLATFTEQLQTYLNTPIPQLMQAQRQKAAVERAVLEAAASALNVEPREVLGSISPDQSLADYLTANGGDIGAVTSEARTRLVAQLEEAVSNERITQEDADNLLTNLDSALETVLNTAGTFQMRPDGGRDGRGGGPDGRGPQGDSQQNG